MEFYYNFVRNKKGKAYFNRTNHSAFSRWNKCTIRLYISSKFLHPSRSEIVDRQTRLRSISYVFLFLWYPRKEDGRIRRKYDCDHLALSLRAIEIMSTCYYLLCQIWHINLWSLQEKKKKKKKKQIYGGEIDRIDDAEGKGRFHSSKRANNHRSWNFH